MPFMNIRINFLTLARIAFVTSILFLFVTGYTESIQQKELADQQIALGTYFQQFLEGDIGERYTLLDAELDTAICEEKMLNLSYEISILKLRVENLEADIGYK